MQTERITQQEYSTVEVSTNNDRIRVTQNNSENDSNIYLEFPSALKLAAALNRLVPAEHNDIYNHKDMD